VTSLSGCHTRSVSRTDSASRVIHAERERVFAALVDADALAAWLPPKGMSGPVRAVRRASRWLLSTRPHLRRDRGGIGEDHSRLRHRGGSLR
jgi:hypothetical protein